MKKIYTIGFTKKHADQFFGLLENNHIEIVVDTRINNTSQLAGFTKADDLAFFLRKICNIKYCYRPDCAPTKELLKDWHDKKITWPQYEIEYNFLQERRGTYGHFLDDYKDFDNICILCSEETPEHCHRRLFAEKLKVYFPDEVEIIHL